MTRIGFGCTPHCTYTREPPKRIANESISYVMLRWEQPDEDQQAKASTSGELKGASGKAKKEAIKPTPAMSW